jgi:hypothetical protein
VGIASTFAQIGSDAHKATTEIKSTATTLKGLASSGQLKGVPERVELPVTKRERSNAVGDHLAQPASQPVPAHDWGLSELDLFRGARTWIPVGPHRAPLAPWNSESGKTGNPLVIAT